MEKPEKLMSSQQRKSIHKGCQNIADILIENGVSLNAVIKNIEIRPTMHSVKDIFRAIGKSKYGVDSTEELKSTQIDPIWEELVKGVSEITGVEINFPSREMTDDYWKDYK